MGTSVSRACTAHFRTFAAAAAAFALTLALAPMASFGSESVAASFVLAESEGSGEAATPNSSSEGSQSTTAPQGGEGPNATPTLASTLAGSATSIVSADVALDSADPIIGSFTVDGLTYAVGSDGLTLVTVAPDAVPDGAIAIPSTVTYDDIAYAVTAVGPYAFYLSGATSVALPVSIASVDSRAFRSSDVGRVEVDQANPTIASFDGALYSADLSSLLLIPEGRAGAVLLPETAEVAQASKFSHCSLVDAISVEEGGAAFASWDGLLYDASGQTLLRVPAGATGITIRDGCTTIAAGALEGCANLERIDAPASVTSISPDVFSSVPIVSLPAQMAIQDEASSGVASGLPDQVKESTDFIPQLTAMVALSTVDDDLPEVDPSSIEVALLEGGDEAPWRAVGLSMRSAPPAGDEVPAEAAAQSAASYAAGGTITGIDHVDGNYDYGHLHIDFHEWGQGYQRKYVNLCQGLSICYGNYYGTDYESLFAQNLPVTNIYADGTLYVMYLMGPQAQKALYWSDGQNPSAAGTEVTFSVSNGTGGAAIWDDLSANLYVPNGQGHLVGLTTESRLKTATRDEFVSGSFSFIFKSGETASYLGSANPAAACLHIAALPVYGGFVTYDLQGGVNDPANPAEAAYDDTIALQEPTRAGHRFLGWTGSNGATPQKAVTLSQTNADKHFVANWERVDFDIGFDVDSEPGDIEYPGDEKDDQKVSLDDGHVAIEDPKRPGYVFEGWVLPNADGTEAVDQELVYQDETDGKWYVDASKLPDYADSDGKVELTARWTSVISVDVPSSVTFYADLVTQGQESREGAASSAFGQSKVANQSQVDLRVVGLESSAVKTEGSTLGADSILKKADAATPSTSAGKLLSLYPSTKQWTADELQDPDAVGGSKATTAVDFDLDDILLEKSFSADDFTIPVGETLNMGYRLNLSESGQQLDYDKLSTLSEGQSASIANVSYCFAADYGPVFWTTDDDGSTLELAAIKADAEAIATGDAATTAKYTAWMNSDHRFHVKWYDQGVAEADNPTKATVYDVRIIGLNHDDRSDGAGKAGITFQFVDCLEEPYMMNYPTCGTLSHYNHYDAQSGSPTYDSWDNVMSGGSRIHNTVVGGWGASLLRARMNPGTQSELAANSANNGRDDDAVWRQMPMGLAAEGVVLSVEKRYLNNQINASGTKLLKSNDRLFIASYSEVVSKGMASAMAPALEEGVCYAFYDLAGTSGASGAVNPSLAKNHADSPDAWRWWLRSTRSNSDDFEDVNLEGYPGSGRPASALIGVAPAFCL